MRIGATAAAGLKPDLAPEGARYGWLFLLAILLFLLRLMFLWHARSIADYAYSDASGHPMSYWMVIKSGASWSPRKLHVGVQLFKIPLMFSSDLLYMPIVVNTIYMILTLALLWLGFRLLFDRLTAGLGVLLASMLPCLSRIALSGMQEGAYWFLACLAFYLLCRNMRLHDGDHFGLELSVLACFAAGMTIRDEALGLLALYGAYLLWRHRRHRARFLTVAAALGLWAYWRRYLFWLRASSVFHSSAANAYKTLGNPGGLLVDVPRYFFADFFPYNVLVVFTFAYWLAKRRKDPVWDIFVLAILESLLLLVLSRFNMNSGDIDRNYGVPMLFMSGYMARALVELAGTARGRRWRVMGAAILAAFLFYSSAAAILDPPEVPPFIAKVRRVGLWLRRLRETRAPDLEGSVLLLDERTLPLTDLFVYAGSPDSLRVVRAYNPQNAPIAWRTGEKAWGILVGADERGRRLKDGFGDSDLAASLYGYDLYKFKTRPER